MTQPIPPRTIVETPIADVRPYMTVEYNRGLYKVWYRLRMMCVDQITWVASETTLDGQVEHEFVGLLYANPDAVALVVQPWE